MALPQHLALGVGNTLVPVKRECLQLWYPGFKCNVPMAPNPRVGICNSLHLPGLHLYHKEVQTWELFPCSATWCGLSTACPSGCILSSLQEIFIACFKNKAKLFSNLVLHTATLNEAGKKTQQNTPTAHTGTVWLPTERHDSFDKLDRFYYSFCKNARRVRSKQDTPG